MQYVTEDFLLGPGRIIPPFGLEPSGGFSRDLEALDVLQIEAHRTATRLSRTEREQFPPQAGNAVPFLCVSVNGITAEISSQRFDAADTRISNVAVCDFLNRALRNSSGFGHNRPLALPQLQLFKNVFMQRLTGGNDTRHDQQHIPIYGYSQPTYKNDLGLTSDAVAKKKQNPRGKKPPTPRARALRRIIAANIQAGMNRHYAISKYGNESAQQAALARDSGVSPSSINRYLKPDADYNPSITCDSLADIAAALETTPRELLDKTYSDRVAKEKAPELESEDLQRSRRGLDADSPNPKIRI